MENFILQISNLKNLDDIINDLSNKEYYNFLENEICKNIDGRICHHKIRILHTICKLMNINSYLEIGVHNGGSMSYVISNNKTIKCYGIDLFDDTYGYYKNEDKINLLRTTLNIEKNNKCSKINLIQGNSFSNKTVEKLKNLLKEKIDLLFIDGDHSYNGVKNDFIKYSEFVKSNGIIILDDFNIEHTDIVKFVYEYINNNSRYKILGVYDNNELIILKL